MQIVRTETPTGSANRTPREEIDPLFTGPREVEPECYWDCSGSEGWPWDSNPQICTWDVQLDASMQFIAPFEALDSQAASEQAEGSDEKGGVFFYPFASRYLPLGADEDDGDLNSANRERKVAAFIRKYFDSHGKPQGTTHVMGAIRAADQHFLGTAKKPGEFYSTPRNERPVRARVLWTDGALDDAAEFRQYLEQATLSTEGFGSHGEWDEAWAVAIIGEPGGGGKSAYDQYVKLAKDHPWIHCYFFEAVASPAEIAEDMAFAVVPVQA